MRAPSAFAAALVALAACAAPPRASVSTPAGIVRADDVPTALWIAGALQRAALRLERLSPSVSAPEVEVWVVADPGGGIEGVEGMAVRSRWSGRWTLRVDADRGPALVGHELFHAHFHDRLHGWPAALVEGLADRFGLSEDILGDCSRTNMLIVVARVPVPELTLEFKRRDGTYAGLLRASSSSCTEGPPPLELERIGTLDSEELASLGYPERLYCYGVGHQAALRWLGSGAVNSLPELPPDWTALLPRTAHELALQAAAELEPARLHRWAVGSFGRQLVSILRDGPAPVTSVEDCMASIAFRLRVGDGPAVSLDDDADFHELLACLWPWLGDATGERGR